VVKDAAGKVVELRCTYDPATRGGDSPDGRKVKATLHWVCARSAIDAEVRLYDHLFTRENPTDVPEGSDWKTSINPNSLEILSGCKAEPSLKNSPAGYVCQFERQGYFAVDPDTRDERPVFNRTVGLRDTWAKVAGK
jgi:glutaminyl-tRNA synthetase